MKPAIAFARKSSTDRQQQSIESQLRDIREYARKNHYEIVRVIALEETGYSAGESRRFRREFEQSKELLFSLAGQYGSLVAIFWSVDRLGRIDPDEGAHFIWECKQRRIQVKFVIDPEASEEGITGNFFRTIKFDSSRQFSETLATSVKRGKTRTMEKGEERHICFSPGGRDPFGFRRSLCDENGKFIDIGGDEVAEPVVLKRKFWNVNPHLKSRYVVFPPEADVVKRVFALASEGKGALRIAGLLNRDLDEAEKLEKQNTLEGNSELNAPKKHHPSVAPPVAKCWSKRSVRHVLQNRMYTGQFMFNRRTVGKTFKNMDPKKVPEYKVVTVYDPSLAIIPRDVFERVQALAASKRTSSGASIAGRPSSYPFSKKIICAVCGGFYVGRRYANGPVYVCSGKRYLGICNSRNDLDGNSLMEVFTTLTNDLLKHMKTPASLKRVVDGINAELQTAMPELSILDKRIVDQSRKLERLFQGEMTPELEKLFEAEKVSLVELEKRRERLFQMNALAGSRHVEVDEVAAFLDTVELDEGDTSRLLDRMLHSITVKDSEAVINLYAAPSRAVIDGVVAHAEIASAVSVGEEVKLSATSGCCDHPPLPLPKRAWRRPGLLHPQNLEAPEPGLSATPRDPLL